MAVELILLRVDSWVPAQGCLGITILGVAFLRLSDPRQHDRSHRAFYESVLKITHDYFHHILFVTQASPHPHGRDYRKA